MRMFETKVDGHSVSIWACDAKGNPVPLERLDLSSVELYEFETEGDHYLASGIATTTTTYLVSCSDGEHLAKKCIRVYLSIALPHAPDYDQIADEALQKAARAMAPRA